MLVWPAAGRRRDAAVAVVLKIMVAMVVLVRVFCTTDKGEVSLTDLMLWNQNASVEQSTGWQAIKAPLPLRAILT